MAHMATNATVQNPIALWRSQLTRFQFPFKSIFRLRRQLAVPGHHIASPVMHMRKTDRPPIPLTSSPVVPASR